MVTKHWALRWPRRWPRVRLNLAIFTGLAALCACLGSQAAELSRTTEIGYVELIEQRPPLLSNVLPYPDDAGLQGARLGIADNNSTGRFTGHAYRLHEARGPEPDPLMAEVTAWLNQGVRFLVANLPSDDLARLSGLAAPYGALIFNSAAAEDALRTERCLGNVLHTIPSRAMLADALGQWLIARKLKRWLLVVGTRAQDQAYADAIRRTARRYGAQVIAEKQWTFDSDLRRTAQAEVPLFTQTADYDVVVVADELGDFGEYLLYNTWYPRPVVGTQGLVPTTWHRVVEQWGAAQLQRRFERQASRWMNAEDYAAWAAVRSIGEGVSRAGEPWSDAPRHQSQAVSRYLLSDQFELGGFKGRKLSYRPWSGQLRQPIPLVHPRALVSQSPQEGYLHPRTDLDTLGYDHQESRCNLDSLLAGD